MTTDDTTDALRAEIADLRSALAELTDTVTHLRASTGEHLPPPPPTPDAASTPDETAEGGPVRELDRRRLLTRAGTAAVGAVLGGAAATVATASPAAAATATFDTSDGTPALTATTTSFGPAVKAVSSASGVALETQGDITVNGFAQINGNVQIETPAGANNAMWISSAEHGVILLTEGTAIWAAGKEGANLIGERIGALLGSDGAQLLLAPQRLSGGVLAAPRTRTDEHVRGEVYFDGSSELWLCVADGSPGTWVHITGPGSAGTFQVLPAPVRAYDTRPDYEPALGPKTPMPANQAREIALSDAGVPDDATAATVSATVTNTTGGAPWGPGYLSLYAGGTPEWPGTSNLNWTGPGQTVAVTTVVPLGPDATLNAYAKHPTDLILDVIGFHR